MPAVRLLTEKPTPGAKTPPKSRGIAFLELLNSTEMQACMKLHHSELNQRRINVELTAGGGGKSATRKGKIAERNTRVGEQRGRKAEKEAEEAAKNGPPPPVAGEGAQGWKEREPEAQIEGFKMRNGRRVKVKAVSRGSGCWVFACVLLTNRATTAQPSGAARTAMADGPARERVDGPAAAAAAGARSGSRRAPTPCRSVTRLAASLCAKGYDGV
jgi:hypothetical protein